MNTQEYFAHTRSIGPFKASDCLRLAREAAELDRLAAVRVSVPPATVSREVLHDGSNPVHLSFGIKVF